MEQIKPKISLEEKKLFVIDFEEFEIDEELKTFNLATKRFVNIFPMLEITISEILKYDVDLEIFSDYIALKEDYTKNDMLMTEFIERINTLFEDPKLRKAIKRYIDDVYDYEETTANTGVKRNINRQLVLNKKHCVDIQQVGAAMKYFIPIISDYFTVGEEKIYNLNTFYLIVFKLLLASYDEHNITNKIYKLAESRITTTQYSNQFIWKFLRNLGKDPENTTLSLYYRIVLSILYKLDAGRNPISYIHTAIKNQLDFTFQENSEIEFQPLNPRSTDENGVTSMDKMQMDYARLDEGLEALQNINKRVEIYNFLKNNPEIKVTDDDIKEYQDIELNKFQINLVFLFFAKYFKTYDMYDLSRNDFILLIVILKKVLRDKMNLTILAKYLTSFGEFRSKKIIMKKDFLIRLSKTKIYNKIFKEYKFVNKKFLEGKDPILFLISTVYFNKWLSYEDFLDGKNEFEGVDERLEEISYEILTFILQI